MSSLKIEIYHLAFQDNSLFPHYNVIQNIQFGAERNKKKKKKLSVDEVVEFLHLEHVKGKISTSNKLR